MPGTGSPSGREACLARIRPPRERELNKVSLRASTGRIIACSNADKSNYEIHGCGHRVGLSRGDIRRRWLGENKARGTKGAVADGHSVGAEPSGPCCPRAGL